MSAVAGSFDGFSRATGDSESLLEAKPERKEAPENIAAVAAWENVEKEGHRRLNQITAAMESTDFTVALQRNRLILQIQRAEKTAESLRRWCDDSQLSRESRIRLEELSIDLDAAIITAAESLNLQESSFVSGLTKGIKKDMSRDSVQNNNMVSSGKEELPICAEPLSTTSNVVLQREQRETLGASTHKPFDLMKDGGDLISVILGQKAEDQIPNFRGGAAEYPAWEEAIAPIRYCSFRQPIMKFNAIKKSLSGEALEIVKWIGLDQPDPVEALVDALKKEYGRPEIVIRAQEVRLEKLASPKEDDYPTLRNFVIAVKSIIATMKAHGYDVEKNPQLTRQLERKLNWVLVKRWCQKRNGDTPNHLLDFLEKEVEILQKAHLLKPDVITGQRTPQVVKAKERAFIGVGNVEKKSSVQRPVGASSAAGTNEQQCPEDRSCRYCHHPLLHHQRRTKEEESSASDQTEKSYICNDSAHHLELLKVFLRCPRKTILTTALIDSGCSRTFVDEDLAKDLGLKVKTAAMILQGIHGAKNVEAARKLRIPGGEVKWADWAKDQPKFAKLPLENVSYADVRILLGQDVKELTENVCTMKVKSDDKKYAAYRCKLGWTISGPRLPSDMEAVMYCCNINDEVDHGTALLQEFRNFNSLEGLGITDKSIGLSRRETEDLEHMQNGTVVLSDGRFQIPMLWKCPGGVPPSEEQAKRRLISLQKKLRLNPRLGELYEKSIQDDKAKGYIRRLSPMEAADLRKRRHWFLPHFAVFHPDKADKCRRVLDAAARNGGVSLNSLLNTGPNLITSLLGVLVRFRCGRIAVNADVKEMFSQVAVPPADSDMLAFLWTSSVDREPDVYVNQRHVFGATCSPAVANFALREAVKRKDAAIAQIVNEAFYMDDLYWSDDNEDVVIQRSQELKTAFREACFELSKWVSNSRKVIETWPMKERACWNGQHPVTKATVSEKSTKLQSCRFKDRHVRYVPSKENPADLISRGMDATGLIKRFDFWTTGPKFLKREEEWPETKVKPPDNDLELRPKAIAFFVGSNSADADKCSTVAEFLKQRLGKDTLNCEDFDREENIIKEAQMEDFGAEISACNKASGRSHIPKSGALQRKQVFLDQDGILRVATRLTNAEFLSEEMKNPIVMPRKHPVTRLVIRSTHNDVGHLGVNSTRAELGRRFFIPKCISTVKHEIYKCKVCRTHRPIAVQVPTAPLHVNRLQYRGFPFVMCGMDFFGPFVISRKQKRWGLIFMCLTTRAIHLEDCVSTNVESFLLALERFIQRRVKPQSIRSDQGTSFVKAAKEQDKSVKALAEELECQVQDKWRIDFKFNPPGAPHWGGSWERMVQEIKKILMSTVESVAGLHQEAFRTLIVRVEGILNRRPITIDENGHSVCPMDIVSPGNKETQGFPTEASTLEVLRQVRQAAQRFWKRWYQFYLASLSADRNHGGKGQIDIRSGDTVLLKEGSNPLVDSYITAKVVEVFRSNDGYVRSAMLKTGNGKEVVRDIRRISIMEGPALERMKMPVVPPVSGGVSHPELVKSIELTTRSSEARNGSNFMQK
ncbi:putative integrase core domain protein [Trichinella spiralis]|nr:putative integrase core domain protein [Trichinella spiralis]